MMKHLGSLDGKGTLVANGKPLGSVHYEVDVWEEQPGGLKSARGNLKGEGRELFQAFTAGSTVIEIRPDQAMNVVLSRVELEHFLAHAEFLVSGPVPGF